MKRRATPPEAPSSRRRGAARRPHWRTVLGVAAGLAAITATVALALTRSDGAGPALPLVPLADAGRLRPAPPAGALGPEGVPIPTAPPLAAPRLLHLGERIDGVTCQGGEQLAFHIHAHLSILVRARPRQAPAGIGAATPYRVALTPAGRFVAAASCFMWLHTHAADGIIHIESPVRRTYTLGEFFDIWGQPLTRRRVGPAHGAVTAIFNGRLFRGDPRELPLLAHSQIELEVGRPLVTPEKIAFPRGL
jgi:hypothetical protein